MAQIRSFLGKIRIEFFAIGFFFLTLVVFALRLYVCRFEGQVIMSVPFTLFPAGFNTLARMFILDALFATVGFMIFENAFARHAKLVFRIGFGVAAAFFVISTLLVVTNATSNPAEIETFFIGRAELAADSVLAGGFGLGFYVYILFLLVYGAVAFLHPGYAGTDEPTLYRFILRKLNKQDPLRLVPAGNDPRVSADVPLMIFYTIITFGVWYYVWMYRLIKAVRVIQNDATSPTQDFLLSALVLPGIQILFALNLKKWEEHLFANRERLGLKKSDLSVIYLILTLLGFGVIAVAMMQLDLNRTRPVVVETVAQAAA